VLNARRHGARQVQHRPSDPVPPGLGGGGEPLAQPDRRAAVDDVEELTAGDIDDRGGPRLGPPPTQAGEQHLIDPERRHCTDPVDIGVQERLAVGHHSVVDGMPVGAELAGDLGHGPAVAAHLNRRPPSRPVGDRQAGRSDAGVLVGP
jgi:hypothetical protein